MIQRGNTIIYKREGGAMDFYWLVDIRTNGYLCFNWLGDINRMSPEDFWEMRKTWFDNELAKGNIEVYDSLPEMYMDIIEKQAIERNNG